MNNPLRTSEDYELFLYRLSEQFSLIRQSTVRFIRRGVSLARVTGELHFDHRILLDRINTFFSTAYSYNDLDVGGHLILLGIRYHF